MSNNTKLLIIFTFLLLIAGVAVLFFGLNTQPKQQANVLVTSPSPMAQSSLVPIATTSGQVAGMEGDLAFVDRVVDGDTIGVVANGEKHTVRLIGVDTPETVDPKRPVGCFGKEASNETKKLLTGKQVILQKDISDTDKYKRWLRFVFLPLDNGQYLFVDDYLIREGFGKVLTIPPDVKYAEQFLQAQQEARSNKRGLWDQC